MKGSINVWVVSGSGQNALYEIHTSRVHFFLSSHEDPANPPKTALLEDNSAPSLYPNTYTAIKSDTLLLLGGTRDVPYPSQASA